jgi:hypothetical protein
MRARSGHDVPRLCGPILLRAAAGFALVVCATAAAAQDADYWTLQYGPVGQLLGGQVIADSRSLSAT